MCLSRNIQGWSYAKDYNKLVADNMAGICICIVIMMYSGLEEHVFTEINK